MKDSKSNDRPRILHTITDLDRMRTHVPAGNEPWTANYNAMAADPRSSATYVMAGPFTYFTRDHTGDQTHLSAIIEDGRAAIQLALRWYITNETSFAFSFGHSSSSSTLSSGAASLLITSFPPTLSALASMMNYYSFQGRERLALHASGSSLKSQHLHVTMSTASGVLKFSMRSYHPFSLVFIEAHCFASSNGLDMEEEQA